MCNLSECNLPFSVEQAHRISLVNTFHRAVYAQTEQPVLPIEQTIEGITHTLYEWVGLFLGGTNSEEALKIACKKLSPFFEGDDFKLFNPEEGHQIILQCDSFGNVTPVITNGGEITLA